MTVMDRSLDGNFFQERCHEIFVQFDSKSNGKLDRTEVHHAIEKVLGSKISVKDLELLFGEFDADRTGQFNECEFRGMMKFILEQRCEDTTITAKIEKAVSDSQQSKEDLLKRIAKDLYNVRDLILIQDSSLDPTLDLHQSKAVTLSNYCEERTAVDKDLDFVAAFSPSEMNCLALVSHNGMKPSMRKFVEANKNLLKKFRLTGTNSTMTMLKEVFKNETPGTVIFGPKCASGPLGGDAQLVGHMVTGHLGGIIFFRDPMDTHPHRADIDCLSRQTLIYNMAMAETPNSAMMMMVSLRLALEGKGRPDLIPSFFFSLQSPTVEAYKKRQKEVVDNEKEKIGKNDKKRGISEVEEDAASDAEVKDDESMDYDEK